MDYLKVADRSWPVLKHVFRGHVAIYRGSGGRIGRTLPGLPPMLLLDHVGARSGRRRTTSLVYMPHGDDFIVVASKGGHPRHPAWLHNLRAHPDTEIQVGRERIPVRAREARGEERARLWPEAKAYHDHWARYEQRTPREIPLVLLERR